MVSYRSQLQGQGDQLTNADGSVKDEVVQAYIGSKSVYGQPPAKYLYDAFAYDSELELKNIRADIDEVVVYGKIPSHSICIPTRWRRPTTVLTSCMSSSVWTGRRNPPW